MNKTMMKIVCILTLNLIVSVPSHAETVEQKDLNFPVKTEELLKGKSHYFFSILSPRKLAVQYPDLLDLDSLSLHKQKDIAFIVTKSVVAINKPVGFFDEKQMTDEKFLSHTLGAKASKTDDEVFNIDGKETSYKMKMYFDADDVSTSPKRVIRAVTAAKKLDVISQSASTIMFMEKSHFTRFTRGGVSISSFQPIKENKTLVITYQLWAITKKQKTPDLESNFVGELEAVKNLMETYK